MGRVTSWWVAVTGAEAGLLVLGPPRFGSHAAEEAAFACLWAAVVALGAYLVIVLGVGLMLRLCRAAALVCVADSVTPGSVRALLDRSMGVVAGSTLSMAVVVGPPVTLRGLRAPTTTVISAPVPTTVVVPTAAHDPPPPPPAQRTYAVQRGDHFWSIAARLLAEARQRPVAAGEVDPYWRALVEENRARLADPGNPDLLFAGQVLAVPAPPAIG